MALLKKNNLNEIRYNQHNGGGQTLVAGVDGGPEGGLFEV
jgi:hypothetical protein